MYPHLVLEVLAAERQRDMLAEATHERRSAMISAQAAEVVDADLQQNAPAGNSGRAQTASTSQSGGRQASGASNENHSLDHYEI
jgi:hypothetical protein